LKDPNAASRYLIEKRDVGAAAKGERPGWDAINGPMAKSSDMNSLRTMDPFDRKSGNLKKSS
jgi:hypothetical protein